VTLNKLTTVAVKRLRTVGKRY